MVWNISIHPVQFAHERASSFFWENEWAELNWVDKKRRAANRLKPNDDSIGNSAEKVRNDNPELDHHVVAVNIYFESIF
jgi:hypothetical protein